jgi:parallel beta-helix repeat protein
MGAFSIATVQPLSPGPSLAPKTYYVNESGLDTNDGSQLTPFREIRKALTLVAPGDTVLVSNGTYLGFDIASLHGTANAWITITALQHNATITVTTDRSDNRDTIFITDSTFFSINGLRSFNANRAAMRIDSSDNITVSNVTFGNNAVWGIFTDFSDDTIIENSELYGSGSQHGIYFSNSPDRPIARNNTIHDNYGCGIHNNGDISMGGDGLVQGALLENNILYNNGAGGGSAINMDGGQNSTVRNNILYNNHATGIAIYDGDASSGPFNDKIYHNTIDMAPDGRYDILLSGSVGPVLVRNNVLYNRNPSHGGMTLGNANDIANTDSDYNIMDRMSPDDETTLLTLAQWKAQGHELHSFSSLPSELFVDVNNRNYHLSSNSTALDKGQNLTSVKFDRDNNPRPSGNASDIGAYEFQQVVVPDTTPPDAILDLVAYNATLSTVDLSWNATGDDAKVGTAAYYDMRYSKSTITGSNWGQATAVNGLPAPLPSGKAQNFTVKGLSFNTKYFFALRATDDKGNTAAVSNVASATTLDLVPNLYIGPSDIVFSDANPVEGDNITINATIHSVNITKKLDFFIECRANGTLIPKGNRTVSLNASSIKFVFNWTAKGGVNNISISLDTAVSIIETDKKDDLAFKTISVRFKPPPPKPDLWVTSSDIRRWPIPQITRNPLNFVNYIHSENLTSPIWATVELRVNSKLMGSKLFYIDKAQIEANITVDNMTKGDDVVQVIVDPENNISESNENNNNASIIVNVPAPDIIITMGDINFDVQMDHLVDETLNITVKVEYTNTPSVTIMVDMLIDDMFRYRQPYDIGTDKNIVFQWKQEYGKHALKVKVDTTNEVDEDNEANNMAWQWVWVSTREELHPLDLYVKATDIQVAGSNIKVNQKIPVHATLHATNLFYPVNATVELLVNWVVMNLTEVAFNTTTVEVSFVWTAKVVGYNNITIRVTAKGGIKEPDKTNNMATVNVPVSTRPKTPKNNYVYVPYILGIIVLVLVMVVIIALVLRRKPRRPVSTDVPGNPK